MATVSVHVHEISSSCEYRQAFMLHRVTHCVDTLPAKSLYTYIIIDVGKIGYDISYIKKQSSGHICLIM